MISTLRGKLIYSDPDFIIIECSGVGFKCFITKDAAYKLPALNSEIMVHTYLSVKEDALDLYAFSSAEELKAFKLITSVNGVGAKIGMAILSQFTPDRLMLIIASNDAKALTAASGVGLKLAQRIVLELKDKTGSIVIEAASDIAAVGNATASTNSAEAIAALTALGFSASDSALAVGKLDNTQSTDKLIKEALKSLSRQV